MSDLSARLNLPYLLPSQAQKHVTHNEALQALDTLVQLTLAGTNSIAPPLDPVPGETHALGDAATLDWAGQPAGRLASWNGTAWLFSEPQEGWRAWDSPTARLVVYQGGAWTPVTPDQDILGVNATADPVNRLAVGAQASLFTHEGAGHQIKVNKAATGDDAGFVFQTDYTSHALFGLLGQDNFTLKVSPDGSTFADAFTVDAATGEMDVAQGLRLGGGDLLSVYEQGSWTPGFDASSASPGGAVFTSSGTYLRIGKLVFLTFEIAISDRGTGGAGNVRITDLPFASSGNFYSADLRHAGVTFPGSGAPIMRSSGTTLTLFSTNGADMLWSDLPAGSGCSLLGAFTYMHNG